MQNSLKMGVGHPFSNQGRNLDAFSILGAREGFAIDFVKGRMLVNDGTTPSNQYDGVPENKLTVYGEDPWVVDPVKGLQLSPTRDFSVAMATANFSYNPSAIHVYARFTLNAADSLDQRYLFMVDNSGADRFAMYTTSGAGFRLVAGDGVNSDTEISSQSLLGDTEYQMFFGVDANGRSWVDDAGVQTNDTLMTLGASTPNHMGLGGYPDRVLRVLDGYLAEIVVICEDVALEKRLTLEPFAELYGAEGDSHTLNVSFGMGEEEFYPARIASVFDGRMVARNAGGSGESSAQMLAQVAGFLAKGSPDVATIYAGSNDVETVITDTPAPDTLSFALADVSKLEVGGYLMVNGESRKISVLSGNVVTLDTVLTTQPMVGDVVVIDTENNIRNWIQQVSNAGCGKIAVIGSHYLNFPIAGDTPDTEQSLRGSVRIKQRSAAEAEGVIYVDTYAHMRNLILSGMITQGDWAAWHQGIDNTHLNGAGEQVLADAVRAAVFS